MYSKDTVRHWRWELRNILIPSLKERSDTTSPSYLKLRARAEEMVEKMKGMKVVDIPTLPFSPPLSSEEALLELEKRIEESDSLPNGT